MTNAMRRPLLIIAGSILLLGGAFIARKACAQEPGSCCGPLIVSLSWRMVAAATSSATFSNPKAME
jgi:hypothetical protein